MKTFLVSSVLCAIGLTLFFTSPPVETKEVNAEPYTEAVYRINRLAGATLWQGGLRRLSTGAPMMEGEELEVGSYYCEKPAYIEINGLGVRQLHQYSVVHIERAESEEGFLLINASTTPRPRDRQPHNWQPGSNRDWVCRITCTMQGFISVCEDGLCFCLRAESPAGDEQPVSEGKTVYLTDSSCGIRR